MMTIDTTQNIAKQRRHPTTGKLLPNVTDTPTLTILDALNVTFRAIRERFPELPNAVLVVGPGSRKTWGHFAPSSWDSKTAKHEIQITGERLSFGPDGVLETLLHEAAHMLGHEREIKDTSRNGRFHNKRFGALAVEVGLVVPATNSATGYNETQLTETTKREYKAELAILKKALKAYRIPVGEKPPAPKTTIRVECECRGVTIPITFFEKGALLCEECGVHFEPKVD